MGSQSMLENSYSVCVCFGTLPSVWTLSSQTRELDLSKGSESVGVLTTGPPVSSRESVDAQQAGRPGAGFCPVPVLGPDQQGGAGSK